MANTNRERCGRTAVAGHPHLAVLYAAAGRYPAAQVTRGFQSLNIPLGLCFHTQACSS
jgi:hypothetical protein